MKQYMQLKTLEFKDINVQLIKYHLSDLFRLPPPPPPPQSKLVKIIFIALSQTKVTLTKAVHQ